MREPHGRWRWVKRGTAGLVSVIALAVAVVVIALHTHWGHELLRSQIEQRLATTFSGGASIGGLEGSPFGELTLHDLVINGPDRRPAISARIVRVSLGLLPLLSHEARVDAVTAEDVDVELKRDARGELEIAHLMRPSPQPSSKSTWSVGLPRVELRRAHVLFDTGSELVNVDRVTLDGHAELLAGGAIDATIDLHGAWRERAAAPLAVQATVHSDQHGLSLPSLAVRAGTVALHGDHVTIGRSRTGQPPAIGGTVTITAAAAEVARLVPAVRLPDDVAVTLSATPGDPWTALALTGRLGHADVQLTGSADLAANHVRGELTTGALDLAALTAGKLAGNAAATVSFDVQPGGARALPIAHAQVRGWTTAGNIPTTTFDIAVTSDGERAHATVDAAGIGVHGSLAADLQVTDRVFAIERATVHLVVPDPERASGGKLPLHGALRADLAAHGTLRPTPSLAVTGTIDGQRIAMAGPGGISASRLHVALDAKRLPDRPYGSAHVELSDLVRGDMQLGQLTLDAADRADGKVAVTLRSQPVQNPWLIDADLLVTPPGEVRASATGAPEAGRGVLIDILRDRIRAGSGTEWTGHSGHIEIGPERIAVTDFESASSSGQLSIGGSVERAGKRAGDLAATIDARAVSLDDLVRVYRGKLDGHLEVSRRAGVWQGDADVAAIGLAIDISPTPPIDAIVAKPAAPPPAAPPPAAPTRATAPVTAAPVPSTSPPRSPLAAAVIPPAPLSPTAPPPHPQPQPAQPARPATPAKAEPVSLDARTHISLHGRRLAITADAMSHELGGARIAIDLDTPAVITDARAWQRLGRSAIRTAELSMRGVDLGRVAGEAQLAGKYTGRLDGSFDFSRQVIGGHLTATNLVVPRLRGFSGVSVALDVTQPSPTVLAPRLTATLPGVGTIVADADLTVPDRMLDLAAWRALGDRMLHSARVRADKITIDPGVLDRFGVVSELRGRLSLSIDIGEAGRNLSADVDVAQLTGKPLAQPIDVHLNATSGDGGMQASLAMSSRAGQLIEARGRLPRSLQQLLDQLAADPKAVKATPITASAKLTTVDAPRLLATFGRSELVAGKLDGTIELAGPISKPTASARIVATGLKTPPGPHGETVRSVERLALTGRWDGDTAQVDLDGVETSGGSLKITAASGGKSADAGTLTLKASKLDLAPLLVFLPGPAGATSGQLDADLTVKGLDLRTTKVAGELHLSNGRVPIAATIGTLRQAKIDAVVAEHDIKLKVDGKLGRGTINVDGSVALDGAAPTGGKARITLREISPIGSVEPRISADVTANLAHTSNQWRADLTVDRGYVVVPEDRGERLKPPGAPEDMRFATGKRMTARPLASHSSAPAAPIFVVNVALHTTQVESEEFRGSVKGNLELRADAGALGLFGEIDADSGDLDLFSHRYQVERASVAFDGSTDPLLNVRITHDYSDVTTITEVHGRASKPELTLSSNPASYSQSELLGFLLGGDPAGDPQGSASNRVADAGTSFLANQLGGYVRHALPVNIDVLRYEAATAASSAAVTVGTWITHALFLAYRQHLESRPDENTGEGEVEYWLSRRVMVDGTAGNRGYDGIDLLWRLRY